MVATLFLLLQGVVFYLLLGYLNNVPYWVVMDKQSTQPNDLRVLVRGNVNTFSGSLQNAPIIVQFSFGQGKVLFTSAHNEGQNTPDLQEILNYIIFEL